MNRLPRILQTFVFLLSLTAFCLIAASRALAADSAGAKPAEGGAMDYMLSYLVVVLGVALGMLIVAKTSNRRDRERPEGYVEKNLAADK